MASRLAGVKELYENRIRRAEDLENRFGYLKDYAAAFKVEPSEEPTSATKSLECAKKVRPLVKEMYARAHEAKKQGRPVAYCMVMSQYDEILRAMDVTPIWTENHGGLCATKRDADRFLAKA